LISKIF